MMELPVPRMRRLPRTLLYSLVAAALLAPLIAPVSPAVAAGPVSISGVVIGSDGDPASVHIEARTIVSGGGWGESVAYTQASADGTFSLDGLVAGRSYRLRLNWGARYGDPTGDSPSHPGFFTNTTPDSLTQDVSRGALFTPGASGIVGLRLALEPATAISGSVRLADGTPVEGIQVYAITDTAYNDPNLDRGHVPLESGVTDASGAFRVRDLEFIGDGIAGYVLRVDLPGRHSGYVGADAKGGLVPIDKARRFPPGAAPITAPPIVIPQIQLPADQMVLGPRISPYKGGSPGGAPGELMAVGSGTLSVFSFEDMRMTESRAVRTGFEDERVYAPGNWGGLDFHQDDTWVPRNDVISVDRGGSMYLYRGDGYGHLRPAQRIGNGWSGYRVIPAGDLTGDNKVDLLAIDGDGYLKLYRGDGKGGFLYPYPRVGNGWKGFQLFAADDLTGDGRTDILSVDSSGRLWVYAGNGNGTFQMRRQVGHGWSKFTLAAGADIDGHLNSSGYPVKQAADIVGRNDATGQLYLYSGNGNGKFAPARQIATGW